MSSFRIRVRSREQWQTTVRKGGYYPSTHQRRVQRWGPWQTRRSVGCAVDAERALDEVKKANATSDVAVFLGGKRLTIEQLRAKANAERGP